MERNEESLGRNQKGVLRALRRYGRFPGGGWVWDNYSTTERILNSLVRRGFATKNNGTWVPVEEQS